MPPSEVSSEILGRETLSLQVFLHFASHVLVALSCVDRMPLNRSKLLAKTWSWLKHGFESRWGHQVVLVDVSSTGFEEHRKVLQTGGHCLSLDLRAAVSS